MKLFEMFKKKPVEVQLTEVELLEAELTIAESECNYAKDIIDKAEFMAGHENRYMLHKRWFLRYTETNLKEAKVKLKRENIKHCDELKRLADIKQYERKRAAEINSKAKLRSWEKVMREVLGDERAQSIIDEADDRVVG